MMMMTKVITMAVVLSLVAVILVVALDLLAEE